MNLDEILNYSKPKETLYSILGCHQSSSLEQITREYKLRALQLHPDKNTDPDSLEKFRAIQEAKEILCDESSRKSYDCWLNSRLNIPFQQWRNRKGHTMHWASPKPTKLSIKEDVLIGQVGDIKPPDANVNNSQTGQDPENWLDQQRSNKLLISYNTTVDLLIKMCKSYYLLSVAVFMEAAVLYV